MDAHENARTTPHSRMLIVERLGSGWSVVELAAPIGVTAKTVRKWRDRFATEGEAGQRDRSSGVVPISVENGGAALPTLSR